MQRSIKKSGILDAFDQALSDIRTNGLPQSRSKSVYPGDLNAVDQSQSKKVPQGDAQNKKGGRNSNKSAKAEKSEAQLPAVEPNLHENPDLPICGPGDIFEWAAYFI